MSKTTVKNKGISISVIKYLALIFMTVDHIGEFIPNTPIWLRYIGRLSSPLFFFAAAEGICHTHDKKNYLLRLYKLSILLETLKLIFTYFFGKYMDFDITNNIFASIFHGTFIIYIFEEHKNSVKKRNLFLSLYFLWQLISLLICSAIDNITGNDTISSVLAMFKSIIFAALGNYLYSAEGAFYLSMMIVLFYFCRNNKKKLAVSYIAYCMIYLTVTALRVPYRLDCFAASLGLSNALRDIVVLPFDLLGFHLMYSMPGVPILELILKYHYQWMMIFVLPLLLLYNGERGNYPKKLFYIYYPLHLFILAGLSILI